MVASLSDASRSHVRCLKSHQGQLASVLLSGARTQPSETECAKMALSMSGHPVFEPIRTTYGRPDVWRHPTPTARKATAPDASVRSQATSIRRREFQAEDRTRRVALLERMIADFERTAADLDR